MLTASLSRSTTGHNVTTKGLHAEPQRARVPYIHCSEDIHAHARKTQKVQNRWYAADAKQRVQHLTAQVPTEFRPQGLYSEAGEEKMTWRIRAARAATGPKNGSVAAQATRSCGTGLSTSRMQA